MKLKITTVILLAIMLAFGVRAEETDQVQAAPSYRNVYVELFGASNLIGISYDARISPGSPFGYRAGIAYTYGKTDLFGIYAEEGSAVTFPVAFNCILGKRASKFEVGVGLNMGAYSVTSRYWVDEDGNPSLFHPAYVVSETNNIFGYFIFSDIGYRLQRRNGFMLRVGVSPSFSFGGSHGVMKLPVLYPYLSLGYTF